MRPSKIVVVSLLVISAFLGVILTFTQYALAFPVAFGAFGGEESFWGKFIIFGVALTMTLSLQLASVITPNVQNPYGLGLSIAVIVNSLIIYSLFFCLKYKVFKSPK
jgi:hypothetical protein